jgi:aspartate/methionine/tyrosine aminotransferase
MTFSRRTRVSHRPLESENALARAVGARRVAAGTSGALLDLTVSNPTTAGLPYDAQAITTALASSDVLAYEPRPLGLVSARGFISADYVASGIEVSSARIAITASTSEAYAVLFKLLCDPGDEILVSPGSRRSKGPSSGRTRWSTPVVGMSISAPSPARSPIERGRSSS